jgi:hypothetical protein
MLFKDNSMIPDPAYPLGQFVGHGQFLAFLCASESLRENIFFL